MRLSIRGRLILAMNLLVIGVGVAVGWAGIEVTAGVVEHRLVDEPAANVAGLFEVMRLPLSDGLMHRLRQVLGSHVLAAPDDSPLLAVSSLPDYEEHTVTRYVVKGGVPRRLKLADKFYLVGEAVTVQGSAVADGCQRVHLYVLVSEPQVEAAKRASARTIFWVTLVAVAIATVLGLWLSTTISRPVRRLADRMHRLGEHADTEPLAAGGGSTLEQGPTEISRLGHSFNTLLGRLEDARQQLARSARLATLGQLSASVAHELRNPLSGIKMNAQVLADALAADGRSDESLQRIIREVDRMELYLAELLGVASGEDGQQDAQLNLVELPPLRVEDVAESVLALLEGRCRHAGIEIRRDWGAGVPAVRADATRLRQVVLNLVLNALDATPPGGTITMATAPADPGGVRFSVTDAGTGVHVPDGANLFDPFVTTKSGGVGLGLYVCRRNIERHGGQIGYESSERGATFWFELPAAY